VEQSDNQQALNNERQVGKKVYRKPSVQVYGTQSDMTHSGPHQVPTNPDTTGTATPPHART